MVNLSKLNVCQIETDIGGGISVISADEKGVISSRPIVEGSLSSSSLAVAVADDFVMLYDGKKLKRIRDDLIIEKGA